MALTESAGTAVNTGTGPILIDNGGAAINQNGTLTTAGTGTAVTIQNSGTLSVGTITAPNGTVVLGNATGPVGATSETGIITANLLTGNSLGGVTLTDANKINTLGPFVSAGLLDFTNAQALTAGGLNAGGGILLTTTSGGLTLNGDLSSPGQSVRLLSADGIIQTGGTITAGMLTGNSAGATNLPNGNLVSGLANFSTSGAFTLFNTVALTQAAGTTVNAGTGAILIDNGGAVFNQAGTLTTVNTSTAAATIQDTAALTIGTVTVGSGGTVTVENTSTLTVGTITAPNGTVVLGNSAGVVGPITNETGIITANLLTGNATGGVGLTGANAVNLLGPFSNAGSGLLAFSDAQLLTTSGTVSSVGGILLTTTSGGLTLGGDVSSSGQTVTLRSAGTIAQSAGVVTAGTLTGNSVGNATFGQNNAIANLASFATSNGDLRLNNGIALNITGPVNTGTGTANLTVGGAITELTEGSITAATLTGSSVGDAIFGQSNTITNLSAFATSGGNFALLDSRALNITGGVNSGSGAVNLTVNGLLTELSGGVITANLVTGSSIGGASLTNGNAVNTFGSFSNTGSGLLAFTDAQSLKTAGVISSAGGILLTTASGSLTLNGDLSSPGQNVALNSATAISQTGGAIIAETVSLQAGGAISQAGGTITAGTLSTQSSGGTTLNSQNNSVATLAASTNAGTGGFSLNNLSALTISGAVNAGADNLTVTSAGKMTILGTLVAGTNATLTGAGLSLGNTANAGQDISLLSSGGDVVLTGSATAGHDLTVSGPGGPSAGVQGNITVAAVQSAGHDLTLNTRPGSITVGANESAGHDLTLNAVQGEISVSGSQNAGHDLTFNGGGDISISASQSAGHDLLGTTDAAINLNGTFQFSAGSNIVLVSGGAFTQRGTLTVTSPDFVIATDDRAGGASALLSELLAAGGGSISNANIIKTSQFAPGNTDNPISFGTHSIDATGSVMLLFADAGGITGTVNVHGLGVSGLAGSADLRGSVDGNTTQTAAQLSFINPRSQNDYKFNDCAIGSATCIILPNLVPIQPQPVSQIDILVARPSEEDLDAPLVNIFDEERLCEQMLRLNPEAAWERCR